MAVLGLVERAHLFLRYAFNVVAAGEFCGIPVLLYSSETASSGREE
jgi:hypothetical protein